VEHQNGRGSADLTERLLAAVVALPDCEQAAALERLCARHRELAGDLRTRYGVFRRLAHCSGRGGPDQRDPAP
jgi:hypothetical protein